MNTRGEPEQPTHTFDGDNQAHQAGGRVAERLSLADRSWPLLGRLMRVQVAIYRATGGRAGHHVPGLPPLLLLNHVGAKSRKRRTSVLAYMPYDGTFIIVGAKGGHPSNPGWVHNLRAFPDTEVQIGPDKVKVHANEAGADARHRLWPKATGYNPAWGRYQQRTQRALPLVILTPTSLTRVSGQVVSGHRRSATGAAKTARHGLTKTLSKELAPAGIMVNVVMPSATRTERMAGQLPARVLEMSVQASPRTWPPLVRHT